MSRYYMNYSGTYSIFTYTSKTMPPIRLVAFDFELEDSSVNPLNFGSNDYLYSRNQVTVGPIFETCHVWGYYPVPPSTLAIVDECQDDLFYFEQPASDRNAQFYGKYTDNSELFVLDQNWGPAQNGVKEEIIYAIRINGNYYAYAPSELLCSPYNSFTVDPPSDPTGTGLYTYPVTFPNGLELGLATAPSTYTVVTFPTGTGLEFTTTGKRRHNWISAVFGKGKLFDPEDPNNGGGNSSGGGGSGDGDIGGTPHKEGEIPSISALDSGLMTLYNPTVAQLQSLGQFLWSDQFSVDNFKKLFNDPFDTLLGLSIVPVSPTISKAGHIYFGNLDSGVACNIVANQFVSVDCGTLTLNEVWNGALDYAPSTQVSIYLPFIGTRQLNTNDVMGSVLHLYYRFDVLTGSCVAEITINHSAQGNKSGGFSYNADMGSVYTFVGQCGINIPLASQDYTNTIRAAIGAVGMAAGIGASVATGNPAIGVASVLTQSANIGMQANTPTVERSGHLSGSGALLSSYEPCLFVTRPHQCKPQKYYALRGIPSQVYVSKLNKATGFFQIADVQNIHCSGATDSELTEIKTKLTQGVFVTTWPSDLSGSSTLDVQLYNNTSAVNRIDKSLTGIRSGDNALDGTFRDSVNIDRPTIRLRINDISDLKHANYMYIAMFERYYFIDSITSVRNNIVEIQGHIDVLKTYGYQIGQNTAILSRSSQAGSSGYGNTYLDDNLLATYQDTYNVSYPWGYTFSHDNDSLILAVAGASVSSSE